MKMRSAIFSALILIFSILLIIFPTVGRDGVAYGILLCGRVIIPSLFPFTMCVLFIMNSGILNAFKFLSPLTERLFALTFFEFILFMLSLIGGYPIGAKLINEAVKSKEISSTKGQKMINFCINAGPAFIISAIGNGIFHSQKIGVVLFVSHITASLIICIFTKKKEPQKNIIKSFIAPSIADNFVSSAASACASLISVCSFVILFSALNSYILFLGNKLPFLKEVAFFLEITNSITQTRNIYFISFLLGFSGLCIWCQVKSVLTDVKINYLKFIFFRLLHGTLSLTFTFAIIKIFKITLPTISNNVSYKPLFSTPALTVSLVIMVIVFVISLSEKTTNSYKRIIDLQAVKEV